MYLLYNMGKYSVRVNDKSKLLEIEKSKSAMGYAEAAELATRSAKSDSENFRRRSRAQPRGITVGQPLDNTHLYDFSDEANKRTVR